MVSDSQIENVNPAGITGIFFISLSAFFSICWHEVDYYKVSLPKFSYLIA